MKNQKGFSVVEVLIVFVVIGLIGTVGWLVWDREQNKTNEAVPQQSTIKEEANSTPVQAEETEAVYEDWLLRKSDQASIRVPDGFTILATAGEDFDFVLPDKPEGSLVYKEGSIAKIIGEPSGHFELGLIVSYNSEGFNDRGTLVKEFKTNSGLDVTVKLFEQTTEPDGLDFAKGTKHLKYTVTKGDSYINIDYAYLGDGIVDTIEEMVKTAEIY